MGQCQTCGKENFTDRSWAETCTKVSVEAKKGHSLVGYSLQSSWHFDFVTLEGLQASTLVCTHREAWHYSHLSLLAALQWDLTGERHSLVFINNLQHAHTHLHTQKAKTIHFYF